MMIGTSGSGNFPGERTVRMNSGPFGLGISQSRMTTSGARMQIASRPLLPSFASWMFLNADRLQQRARDLAHGRLVVDDEHLQRSSCREIWLAIDSMTSLMPPLRERGIPRYDVTTNR